VQPQVRALEDVGEQLEGAHFSRQVYQVTAILLRVNNLLLMRRGTAFIGLINDQPPRVVRIVIYGQERAWEISWDRCKLLFAAVECASSYLQQLLDWRQCKTSVG
jgi:hypothetical protein